MIVRPVSTVWTRLLSFILSLAVVLFAVAPALAATIQTDLWVYQQGDTVNVTGDGFDPSENVEIVTTDPYAVEVDRGTVLSDANGNIAYSFVLNSDVPGIYDVVATGLSSGLSASTQFDPTVNLQFSGGDGAQHPNTPGENRPNVAKGTAVAFNTSANAPSVPDGTSVSWAVAQISGPAAVLSGASGTFTNPPGGGPGNGCCTGAPAAVGVSVATGSLTIGTNYVVRLQMTGTSSASDTVISQDLYFNFTVVASAKGPGEVSINNIPVSAVYGGSFTPAFDKLGDGIGSAASLTPLTCSITDGVVDYLAAGSCTLQASVTEGTNYLAATGDEQSFNIAQADAVCSVTGYDEVYDGDAHTASGSCTGVDGEDLSADLDLSGTTHTNAGFYADDPWTFTDSTGNYNDITDGIVDDNIAKADAVCTIIGYTGNFDFNEHGASGSCLDINGDPLDGLDLGDSFSSAGIHTAFWTFTDVTGNYNDASGSVSIVINSWWTLKGFYQPVDMGGIMNTVKGGSTVPLKFEVFAGTTELISTSVVTTFLVQQVTCGTVLEDPIETLSNTGGTSMRYDSTSGQFIQNWQTPKPPGKCYTVFIKTADGSSIYAMFKTN
jgi:hypothetical protein